MISSLACREGLNRSLQRLQSQLEANTCELEGILEACGIIGKAIEQIKMELAELGHDISEDELVDDE